MTTEPLMTAARSLPAPLTRWWLRARPARNAVQIGPAGIPPCVEFFVPWWAWPLELMHRAIFGRARIVASLALAALTLSSCSAVRDVFRPVQNDPVRSALYLVKETMIEITSEWFIPTCVEKADPPPFCRTWEFSIDPAIVSAHNAVRRATAIADGTTTKALQSLDVALGVLDDVIAMDTDSGRRKIYERARAAVEILRTEFIKRMEVTNV